MKYRTVITNICPVNSSESSYLYWKVVVPWRVWRFLRIIIRKARFLIKHLIWITVLYLKKHSSYRSIFGKFYQSSLKDFFRSFARVPPRVSPRTFLLPEPLAVFLPKFVLKCPQEILVSILLQLLREHFSRIFLRVLLDFSWSITWGFPRSFLRYFS